MSSKAKKQSKPRNKAPNQSRKNQLVVYNPQVQEGVYTSELGQLLKNHIEEKVKPFKKYCQRIVRGELESTEIPESPKGKPKRKKELKSIEIAKTTISFEFLGDQEALRRFPGIESVFPKLSGWEVKGVKRKLADTCDTYYFHETAGTTKLRSINEVVNHLLPVGYPKLKGKIKENDDKDENLNPESREKRKRRKGENKVKVVFLGSSSSSSSSQKNKEQSKNLREVSAVESSEVKKVSRKRKKNSVFLGSSSSSQKNEEKSIIPREVLPESSKIQIVIPSDDERLEDMLNNCADNDKSIVAVGNKMDEDLDEIIEEFPEYDDLANQFFN